jgi:hypothetical protein
MKRSQVLLLQVSILLPLLLAAALLQAQPQWISSLTSTGSGATASVTIPAGTVAGDLLVVGLIVEHANNATVIVPPAGWTLIRRSNNGTHLGLATYYTVVTTPAASVTFQLSPSVRWAAGISRITGADPLNPIMVSQGATGASGNVVSPAVTTTAENALVLSFHTNRRAATFTPPAGTIERYDAPNIAGTLPSNMLCTFERSTAGSSGARTAIPSQSGRWAAQQVAIRCYVPPTPTGPSAQAFCDIPVPTLADIEVNGTNVLWYPSSSGGSSLPLSTPLVDGATYYAGDPSGCGSAPRLSVQVQLAQPAMWYADQDNDGLGDPTMSVIACTPPAGYVANSNDECPVLPGTIGDACSDGDPNTVLDTVDEDCTCVGQVCTTDLALVFQGDGSSTITWEIRQQGTDVLYQSGSGLYPAASIQNIGLCVPDGCYTLRVLDDAGDGMAGGGYILMQTGPERRIIDNRFNFTSGFVSAISGDQGFCLPLGTDRLIFTSCDKLDWVNNQFIVASANEAVSALWIEGAPNSAQSTTTGYEFWFFDPNGSYSYRRFRNHATSGGFGNVGATRACHLLINSWNEVNHIPEQVLMNVRVRSRVLGANSEWGPACRFMIDSEAAACPQTKLNDIPGSSILSCGQYRSWDLNSYAWARPVSGASQYQFRFRQPAEGYEVVRTTTTYSVRLFWTVPPPLITGSQYEVDVRAFKNGQWCPWGDVCTLNIELDLQQGMAQQRSFGGDELALQMWPNPNNGDLLHLSISEIPEGVELVHVDLFDMFGKRVMTRSLPVNEGPFLTLLNLNGDMASGMYTLNLLIGEEVISQRLVIQR